MKLNTLLNGSLAVALLTACAPQLPKDSYLIEGTINGMEGQEIYLSYSTNSAYVRDTAVITNGTFKFEGKQDIPARHAGLFMGDERDWMSPYRCEFYMEPAHMTIAIDTASFCTPVITGSVTQAEYDSLGIGELSNQMMDIYKLAQQEADKAKRDSLQALTEPLREQYRKLVGDFIATHHDSFLLPGFLRDRMGQMSYDEMKAAYDNLSDRVKQYGDLKEFVKEMSAQERILPGKPAPDICKEDVNGDTVSISSLKGKYVLLDFWASWCKPCRASFPHVKALYEKYHAKGFEVFCVADNDSQTDAWKKAIEDDGVEKFYHVLRGLKADPNNPRGYDRTNDVSDKYAVHYLPTKFLIDKDGNMMGKFEDEELDAKLKEIFGE